MKKYTFTFLIVFTLNFGFAQRDPKLVDSLKNQLAIAKHDTSRIKILINLCSAYIQFEKDSCQLYGDKALETARRINDTRSEAHALIDLSISSRIYGDAPQSLQKAFKGLEIAEKNNYTLEIGRGLYSIGVVYGDIFNDYHKAINYFKQAKQVNSKTEEVYPSVQLNRLLDLNIGKFYCEVNQLDSAIMYLQKLKENRDGSNNLIAVAEMYWSELQYKLGNKDAAMQASAQAVNLVQPWYIGRGVAEIYFNRAELFNKINKPDSSIYYAKFAISVAKEIAYTRIILFASQLLADEYETKDKTQSIYYHKLARSANDNLYGKKKMQEIQRILADEQERKKIIEADEIARQNRVKQYLFFAGLSILLLIAFILYRNNQKEKKAKNLLQEKNDEIQLTLSKLKATQAQLIQSEKLASLGELTAGIAHEIQNPLNFVNNFSELSVDLVKDLKEEIDKPEQDKEYIGELFDDLSQNQEKINHHGKRASSIVKGMLEHSRTSTGVKELTDINKLADEYLRLSYHGLRAKDNSFNADFSTDFDENLPKIEVIPQDIGRVLLNLINNAFYAVNQRKQVVIARNEAISNYTPSVSVTSQQLDNKIIIKVKDNGIGMSEATKAKVFQPFFTTKPTGQGTGLGLSLAYDIITKGHGGSLEVESTERIGSEFIITLPI